VKRGAGTRNSLCLGLVCLAVASFAAAQQFDLPESAAKDPAALSKAVPGLAKAVMAVYKDDDRGKYLDNLFRLQIVAGQYEDAIKTTASLRELLRANHQVRSAWVNIQYEIYARAKARENAEKLAFNEAYTQSFRDAFSQLDDRTSALVVLGLTMIDPSDSQQDVQNDLEKQKSKSTIPLADAVKLISDYQIAEAYRAFAPLNPALIAEDDRRRYVIEKDIPVKTPDGATVCALIVRPRRVQGRLPTLLKFTIYVDPNSNIGEDRVTAANGYAGVIGFTRGKACSPDKPVPYLHDGPDAAALIDWISAQPWSDGRVGMYGGSYEGFTQWAVTKQMPKALKALMTGAPAGPGIDVPMEGNVFWNFVYPWPFYTTNAKGADDTTYSDRTRWRRLNHDWYVSGRAYRDLEKIDGTPNPIFDQWIAHPSYDDYWQSMIPYNKEFARINIPTLVTIGYYYGGPGAGVYYFGQHEKYDPKGEHYLLIGPYDHPGAQYGVIGLVGNLFDNLAGLKLDPVAILDLTVLRYEWFDYIFKSGPKPAILADKVSYEVTGANAWKHAPTLAAMSNQTLRFHLTAERSGTAYRLREQKPSGNDFVPLKIDFAERSDVDRNAPGGGVVDTAVDTWNGIEFVSDPLPKATELSGLFSGRLDFVCNKKDFDFEIDLYEQTPKGEYVQLTSYWTRASYVGDRTHRRLLTPDKSQKLDFESVRLMSRQLQPGSRVVAVLSVIKEPGRQINYGTGKDVSDETIADAKEPLQIKWFGDSYIVLPVGR
jgi:putative CocE/NonD family hydrolase